MKTKGVMSIIVCEKQEKRGEGEEIPLRIPFACIEEIESTFDAFLELEPTGFYFLLFLLFFCFLFIFLFSLFFQSFSFSLLDHTVFSSQMEQILEIWNSPDADILSATKFFFFFFLSLFFPLQHSLKFYDNRKKVIDAKAGLERDIVAKFSARFFFF